MTEEEIQKLIEDTVLYGLGLIVAVRDRNGNVEYRRVPTEEYEGLADHLKFIVANKSSIQ